MNKCLWSGTMASALELWWLHLVLGFKIMHQWEMCESNYHPDFLWSPSPYKNHLWISLCTGLSSEVQPLLPTFSFSQLGWWSFHPSCFWGWISSKLLAFSFPQPPHLFLLLYKVHLESARPSGFPRWHFHKVHGSPSGIPQEGHRFDTIHLQSFLL